MLISGQEKLTNRKDTWLWLFLSSVGCECEGKLDTPCILEPRCDTHKLSLVWIVLPFHFFTVKHTPDVIWSLSTWAINLDRCPTKNGATPGNQEQLTWNYWHEHLSHGWTVHFVVYTYMLAMLVHAACTQVLWWSMHEDCHAAYEDFLQSCKENCKPSMRGDRLRFTFAASWNIYLHMCWDSKGNVEAFYITQEVICLIGWKTDPTEIGYVYVLIILGECPSL